MTLLVISLVHNTVDVNVDTNPQSPTHGLARIYSAATVTAYPKLIGGKTRPPKRASLVPLHILLLILSADIEQNPGPQNQGIADYPCGSCDIQVKDDDMGIQCDDCNMWFHISCQNLDPNMYHILANHSLFMGMPKTADFQTFPAVL